MQEKPGVFAGIDWASVEHQVCLMGGGPPVQRTFAHDALGIGALVDWLVGQADHPQDIAVAIETPHGPVVEALMDRGIAVFAIDPKQLDRFRDRFSPAGAKDDRRDALVLASALRTDRHCFRRLVPLDPLVVELREWSRMAEELKEERTRLANRIRQQLWRYYPQALEITDDAAADWFLRGHSRPGRPAHQEEDRARADDPSHPPDRCGRCARPPATAGADRSTRNNDGRQGPHRHRGRAGASGQSPAQRGYPPPRCLPPSARNGRLEAHSAVDHGFRSSRPLQHARVS